MDDTSPYRNMYLWVAGMGYGVEYDVVNGGKHSVEFGVEYEVDIGWNIRWSMG